MLRIKTAGPNTLYGRQTVGTTFRGQSVSAIGKSVAGSGSVNNGVKVRRGRRR